MDDQRQVRIIQNVSHNSIVAQNSRYNHSLENDEFRKPFPKEKLQIISLSLTATGLICIMTQFVLLATVSYSSYITFFSQGFWCGLMTLPTGLMGIWILYKATRTRLIVFLVLCALSVISNSLMITIIVKYGHERIRAFYEFLKIISYLILGVQVMVGTYSGCLALIGIKLSLDGVCYNKYVIATETNNENTEDEDDSDNPTNVDDLAVRLPKVIYIQILSIGQIICGLWLIIATIIMTLILEYFMSKQVILIDTDNPTQILINGGSGLFSVTIGILGYKAIVWKNQKLLNLLANLSFIGTIFSIVNISLSFLGASNIRHCLFCMLKNNVGFAELSVRSLNTFVNFMNLIFTLSILYLLYGNKSHTEPTLLPRLQDSFDNSKKVIHFFSGFFIIFACLCIMAQLFQLAFHNENITMTLVSFFLCTSFICNGLYGFYVTSFTPPTKHKICHLMAISMATILMTLCFLTVGIDNLKDSSSGKRGRIEDLMIGFSLLQIFCTVGILILSSIQTAITISINYWNPKFDNTNTISANGCVNSSEPPPASV